MGGNFARSGVTGFNSRQIKLFSLILNELKDDEKFLSYILENHFGATKDDILQTYHDLHPTVEMDKNPRTLLKQKVSDNFAMYRERWLKMQPSELIDCCEEMEAVTRMAKELPSAVSEENAQFLLRFRNPLEVVSDAWISRNGIESLIVDDEMSHLLWSLRDQGDIEEYYEMEPEFSDEDEGPSLSM